MLTKNRGREKDFFPVFIDIEDRNCLVIGGGKIAFRKIRTLKSYGGKITVIAPEILDEILELEGIEIVKRKFERSDLAGRFLVVAATDSEELNSEIAHLCREKNILVNNITSKSEMNLSFASVLETEEFQIGISGRGNPKKALKIREIIKKALTLG